MITAATIAALNQHLASVGLLPGTGATPSDKPFTGTDPLPPAPRAASPALPKTLPVHSHFVPRAPAPVLSSTNPTSIDTHHSHDDRSPPSSSSQPLHRFHRGSISKMQVEYRTLGTRRVPRVQPLQFSDHTDRTADTQLLVHLLRDALSGIFDVGDPSGSVTMRSLTWVSGWYAPLLKLTKSSILPNRDDTYTLHRLVDDLFAQLQERLASGVDGPATFRALLTDVTEYFDRAPRAAALETLRKFGVPSGTPFSSFLRSFRVVVAIAVDKGGPLAPLPDMAIKLIRSSTAQQYPMLIPTLFPGNLATQKKPYDSLATLWTAFTQLKHNTSTVTDGDAFASAPQGLSSLTHHIATSSGSPVTSPHRNTRRTGRQDVAHGVLNVSLTHSRTDPLSVDYGLWPSDDRDYDIVCTVANNIVNTDLSLWTPFLSEDARRQACVQYKGRCCKCNSTEHGLHRCPTTFKNTFSLLNPEFETHDPDGSGFETLKLGMRRWRQRAPPRGRQGNHRRSGSDNNRPHYINNRRHNPTYHGNLSGIPRAPVTADARNFWQRPHHSPQAPITTMRHGGQVRQVLNLRIPTYIPRHTDSIVAHHDDAKTAETHPSRCLQHYPMDCSTQSIARLQRHFPVAPEPGDTSVYPKPPTLSLCMELIRQTRRHFRGVGGSTPEGPT